VPAFGFDEDLVAFAFCEAVDFVFYGWTIAGTKTFDAALEHWGPVESFLKFFMDFVVCVGDPAAYLFCERSGVGVGKLSRLFIAGLFLHYLVVEGPAINSGRCSGFHSSGFETKSDELFG